MSHHGTRLGPHVLILRFLSHENSLSEFICIKYRIVVLFAKWLSKMNANEEHLSLEAWINKTLSTGKMSFSLAQLKEELQKHSDIAIKRSLDRLSKKGTIISIHKGYYLIIPPQYISRGVLPPQLFIDALMKYLERPYYVGLLSAAAMHGAAHQQPQEFYVITTPPALRPTHKKSLKINYITKSAIPEKYLDQKKTETGYIKVSSPELTALDLFRYDKRVGGLNRIGTILNELTEAFQEERINEEFVKLGSASSVQRLGYMLDNVLENQQYADKLFEATQKANVIFNRIPLDGEEETLGFSSANRWNVIVNAEIDIDE